MFQVKLGVALWDEEIVEGVRVIGEHSEGLPVVVDRTRHVALRAIQKVKGRCTIPIRFLRVQTLAE